MKKILLTIAAIALLAAPASAQVYSLWSDEEMQVCDFHTEDIYVYYTVFIMVEPGPDGVSGAEYKLIAPPGANFNEVLASPFASAALGSVVGAPGNSVAIACQTELFWLYSFRMLVMPESEPGMFQILPHDDTGLISVSTCELPLKPIIDATVYNYFGFNEACVVGTEESSWGAIKSMMD